MKFSFSVSSLTQAGGDHCKESTLGAEPQDGLSPRDSWQALVSASPAMVHRGLLTRSVRVCGSGPADLVLLWFVACLQVHALVVRKQEAR